MNKDLFNKFLDGETSATETRTVLKAIRTTPLWRQRYVAVKRYEAMLAEDNPSDSWSDLSQLSIPIQACPPDDRRNAIDAVKQPGVRSLDDAFFEDSFLGAFHCPDCGKPIALTHVRCPHCGRELGVEDY